MQKKNSTSEKGLAYVLGIAFVAASMSCQKPFDTVKVGLGTGENTQSSENPSPQPSEGGRDEPESVGAPTDSLSICSKINFSGLSFPSSLNESQKNSFALALNVTGSFEGHMSWASITNNFDGMGISLGLLQQNFGTGTLQPLLIQMKSTQRSSFLSIFSQAHYLSLGDMLNQWQDVVGPSDVDVERLVKEKYLFVPDQYNISNLDEDYNSDAAVGLRAISKNQISVNWAVNNVLNGANFREGWKNEFTALANTTEYKNLQLNAATEYHARTFDYLKGFDFTETRFYLLLFDFVTQNGGFKESHWNEYVSYRKKNPSATEEQRALKLLEIRLASVRSQYREDVRSRKMAIIKGSGVVHGSARQLAKEYCYEPQASLR